MIRPGDLVRVRSREWTHDFVLSGSSVISGAYSWETKLLVWVSDPIEDVREGCFGQRRCLFSDGSKTYGFRVFPVSACERAGEVK